jgi:hypothetical protein
METSSDSIPSSVRTLLELLSGDLAAVRFPDVDGERLAGAARDVETAARAADEAEAALETARRQVADRQEALLACAHRALGYLRVFADGDPALETRLAHIALPRRGSLGETAPMAAEPVARRRGRPPKNAGAPLLEGTHSGDGPSPVAITVTATALAMPPPGLEPAPRKEESRQPAPRKEESRQTVQ